MKHYQKILDKDLNYHYYIPSMVTVITVQFSVACTYRGIVQWTLSFKALSVQGATFILRRLKYSQT